MSRQGGFTLIELMISIALSLLVLAGVLGAYLAGSQANRQMQDRVALQQDVRFAMTGLTRELRMAGAFGCALPYSALDQNPLVPIDSVAVSSPQWTHYTPNTIGIFQQAASGSGWVNATGYTPAGDVLVIQYGAGGVDATVATDASATVINNIKATLPLDRPQLASAAVLALTNCQRLEFMSNNGVLAGDELTVAPVGGAAIPGATESRQWELMRLVTLAYSVGTYRGRQGLYLFELGEDGQWSGPKEIANGVTSMTTEFGIQQCTPGTTQDVSTQYYQASALSAADWRRVGLVRLTLNAQRRGLDASGTETNIQRNYTTTIALRRENLCLSRSAS